MTMDKQAIRKLQKIDKQAIRNLQDGQGGSKNRKSHWRQKDKGTRDSQAGHREKGNREHLNDQRERQHLVTRWPRDGQGERDSRE